MNVLCRGAAKPFEWMGSGCNRCADSCSGVCDCVCKALSACCAWSASFFEKPFSCYAFFAVITNLTPFAICIHAALSNLDNACPHNLGVWLTVECALFLCNLAMAAYLMRRMARPYDPTNAHDRSFSARVSHLCCDDEVTAAYILVAVFMIVWQILGAAWLADASHLCASSSLRSMCKVAATFTWIFIAVGGLLLFLAWVDNSGCLDECCCGFLGCLCPEEERRRHEPQRHHRPGTGSTSNAAIVQAGIGVASAAGALIGGAVRSAMAPQPRQPQYTTAPVGQAMQHGQVLAQMPPAQYHAQPDAIPVAQPATYGAAPPGYAAPVAVGAAASAPPPPAHQQPLHQQFAQEQQSLPLPQPPPPPQEQQQRQPDAADIAVKAGTAAGKLAVAGGKLAFKGAVMGMKGAKAMYDKKNSKPSGQ